MKTPQVKPKPLARKHSIRWMGARLRRLQSCRPPTDRQKARIKQLNQAINLLEGHQP